MQRSTTDSEGATLEISNGLRAKLDHLTGQGDTYEYEDGKLLTKFGVISETHQPNRH